MFFNDWLDILLFKKKPADIAKTSLGEGLKHLVIASVIVGILNGIYQYLAIGQLAELTGTSNLMMGFAGPLMIVATAIMTPIIAVIGIIIGGAILHLFCLILGGKGDIGNYIGVLAMISAAIAGTATAVITVIQILGTLAGAYLMMMMVAGLLALIVGLWQLVLVVLATQAVQQLSLGRAIVAVIVIPLIIAVVLAAVMATVLFAFIASMVPTGMGSLPMA